MKCCWHTKGPGISREKWAVDQPRADGSIMLDSCPRRQDECNQVEKKRLSVSRATAKNRLVYDGNNEWNVCVVRRTVIRHAPTWQSRSLSAQPVSDVRLQTQTSWVQLIHLLVKMLTLHPKTSIRTIKSWLNSCLNLTPSFFVSWSINSDMLTEFSYFYPLISFLPMWCTQ